MNNIIDMDNIELTREKKEQIKESIKDIEENIDIILGDSYPKYKGPTDTCFGIFNDIVEFILSFVIKTSPPKEDIIIKDI